MKYVIVLGDGMADWPIAGRQDSTGVRIHSDDG